ncbi:XrtA system polysaccharide deacetylase [Planctomycetota bacterium]
MNTLLNNILSIDVEDWFHILDSPSAPDIDQWSKLPLRVEHGMEQILLILGDTGTKATFFWLGWMAERFPKLLRMCHEAGHEIANHGYGHVLAYKVGHNKFKLDVIRGKEILEDLIGEPVRGFRAPGFGITDKTPWAFDVIKEAGNDYDSSIFPASRGHGGINNSPIGPYFIMTQNGMLPEIPMSVVEMFGRRFSMFGGGYLRLATRRMIRWGIDRLLKDQQPLIVYVHPREIDPDHPRLPLSPIRRFRSYVNLKSTFPKLQWLCENYSFCTMHKMVEDFVKSFYYDAREGIPVVKLQGSAPSDRTPFRFIPLSARSIESYRTLKKKQETHTVDLHTASENM